MPTTRKKVIKTVYKDDDDNEGDFGDFSDSGSEAHISDESNSEDEDDIEESSEDDFIDKNKKKKSKPVAPIKPISIKRLINKVHKQSHEDRDNVLISVKDLTEEDKLLPSILNLSESDSSEDESTSKPSKIIPPIATASTSTEAEKDHDSDDIDAEYKDVWSKNGQDNSEDIAKKAFMELHKNNTKIEETKASINNYKSKQSTKESNVKDLLALGEDIQPEKTPIKKKNKIRKTKVQSESETEDWEEVKESKSIPQQGLQLFVEFPDAACRKKKVIDVEMMMKRKLNRTKKEYQVYMHKVHVLCWLAHGNYVSRILNDQEIMAAALSLVPSKECYPGDRVDLKYIEQITSWFKDKITLKQDKNEDKFKPKAPPLKEILLTQLKSRVVTTKKYIVCIFVAMLRALGLQCRVMFNFVTLPLKPPVFELCSLSTKPADITKDKKLSSSDKNISKEKKQTTSLNSKAKSKQKKVAQLDGCYDIDIIKNYVNIAQLDGSNDDLTTKTRSLRSTRANRAKTSNCSNENEEISPPKKLKKNPPKSSINLNEKATKVVEVKLPQRRTRNLQIKNKLSDIYNKPHDIKKDLVSENALNREEENSRDQKTNKLRQTTDNTNKQNIQDKRKKSSKDIVEKQNKLKPPKITVTNENHANVASMYFEEQTTSNANRLRLSRKRTHSADSNNSQLETKTNSIKTNKAAKTRTKSAPGSAIEESKYFNKKGTEIHNKPRNTARQTKKQDASPEKKRVNHRDLMTSKIKPKNDVTSDLIDIIKNRIKQESPEMKKGKRKGGVHKKPSDPECSDSDDDFKPTKLSPKPITSKVIDRRVLSSDEDTSRKHTDVWCEIFVEELEQWICVDLITGKIHDSTFIYNRATHPVCYVVSWDNNNYLKDLTRKYVPHWNTVTRKLRAEQPWWDKAVQSWLGPKTARDREEDEFLDKMQLEAPLPKSIAEYKNHPLYALKRHLLKFEAIYPEDAATLGFVRGEPVYARACVHVCRSRDTWLKEAKVVRLAETPYKIVKARPKWDKLSNKLITDKPLEVFGPWQVQDYEPPVAENGIVPRNAYGNVELFKECMLPKGTVHIKLPGLNKVARKLNIDCAPAMTGFDFNGGWSHPVYDGFVVCKEYGEIITEAWIKDQEEQERREREKTDARVYGNWKKLIKGLLIRERIKKKYGFENPTTSQENKNKAKTPRYVAKKK